MPFHRFALLTFANISLRSSSVVHQAHRPSSAALNAHRHLISPQIVRVLYEARAESAAVPTTWESADQLGDSRLQQQRAVQRLEEQRPRVLAAVQRGRDLHRDLTGAPAILPEALEQLETAWAQSNAEIIQRLDSATGQSLMD